jgi:hypothetical protein
MQKGKRATEKARIVVENPYTIMKIVFLEK